MIGFNLNEAAGKTAAETQKEKEEAEYEEMLEKYISRFMEWADDTEKRASKTYEMQRDLYYALNQSAWIMFCALVVVCFALGWNAHAIYFQAVGVDLTAALGSIIR